MPDAQNKMVENNKRRRINEEIKTPETDIFILGSTHLS